MFNKVCLSWQWSQIMFKPQLRWWLLHPTRQTPSLLIPSFILWWKIHASQLLFHSFLEYLQLEEKWQWFMFLGSWKMNATLILFHSWKTKCAINWMVTCNWLLLWKHIFFSHWIHFHTRLLTIFGHMSYQNMAEVDMLEIGSYFCNKISLDMLLDNIAITLLPSFSKIININS